MKERTQDECPKCHSKMKAIVGTDLVCLGCDYIYRRNVEFWRKDDKTLAELKQDWQ